MNLAKGRYIGLIITIAGAIILYLFYFNVIPKSILGIKDNEGAKENASSTQIIRIGDYNIEAPIGVTITATKPTGTKPVVNLDRPIVIPDSFTKEVADIYRQRINAWQETLKKDSTSFDTWIQLGIDYKNIGDYKGAEEAWNYASYLSAKNVISYSNLGSLYQYYLKEYKKAEENLLKVIDNDPTYILGYRNLHDLYRLSYQIETSKAVDILKQGLSKNPGAIDLLLALASYYEEKENIPNARLYYKEALNKAKALGDSRLEAEINAKLSSLQ